MPSRIAAVVILLALFPKRSAPSVPGPPSSIHQDAVTNSTKAGLAWPNSNYDDISQFLGTGKVQWYVRSLPREPDARPYFSRHESSARYYTWGPEPVQTDIEFAPMLWGASQTSDWDNNINNTVRQQHVTHVLGFNEPEISGQSNLTPADAATLWKAHIEPLKGLGVKLGSPARAERRRGNSGFRIG